MAALMQTAADELEAVISALVGGARYGVKIRAPHALVMTFLFRSNQSFGKKMQTILKLTRVHAVNLATFATIYKTVLALLKLTSRMIQSSSASVKKGILNNIGKALLQTIVDGPRQSGRRLVDRPPGFPERRHHAFIAGAIGGYFVWGRYNNASNYPIFASIVWATVMTLFEEAPESLQSSLKKSMDDIYRYKIPGMELV